MEFLKASTELVQVQFESTLFFTCSRSPAETLIRRHFISRFLDLSISSKFYLPRKFISWIFLLSWDFSINYLLRLNLQQTSESGCFLKCNTIRRRHRFQKKLRAKRFPENFKAVQYSNHKRNRANLDTSEFLRPFKLISNRHKQIFGSIHSGHQQSQANFRVRPQWSPTVTSEFSGPSKMVTNSHNHAFLL